jgi:hypothetical protein
LIKKLLKASFVCTLGIALACWCQSPTKTTFVLSIDNCSVFIASAICS